MRKAAAICHTCFPVVCSVFVPILFYYCYIVWCRLLFVDPILAIIAEPNGSLAAF